MAGRPDRTLLSGVHRTFSHTRRCRSPSNALCGRTSLVFATSSTAANCQARNQSYPL